MRYFLEISYLGTNYHGWQIQPNSITIQGVLEDCISKLLKLKIKLVGAGRTDTGVHANQMFAHFDIDDKINDTDQMIYKLNSFLPHEIVVKKIFQVNNKAHARFDAVCRSYEYFISTEKNPFELNKSYYLKNKQQEFASKLNNIKDNVPKLIDLINNQNLNEYIKIVVKFSFEANKYFNDQEPWKKKDNPLRLNTIVYSTLEIVRKVSFLLYPIIPQSSLKALKIFNLTEKDIDFASIGDNTFLKQGNSINKINILFNKIEKKND